MATGGSTAPAATVAIGGVRGAAGLLLVSDGWVLLQQRSPGSHHGGTWSIPGGAMRSGETAERAAVREAVEEVDLDPDLVDVVGSYVDQHGPWSYTTVIATHQGCGSMRSVTETAAVQWVTAGLVSRATSCTPAKHLVTAAEPAA